MGNDKCIVVFRHVLITVLTKEGLDLHFLMPKHTVVAWINLYLTEA